MNDNKLKGVCNRLDVSFFAKTENVTLSRSILIGFLVNLDLPMTLINELKTALSEAVTNAIVHGYDNDENKMVKVSYSYDNERIYLDVEDMGIGIENIEQAREPLYSSKIDEERAGLGFTIMEVFTDELKIESQVGVGTKVHMSKIYENQYRD